MDVMEPPAVLGLLADPLRWQLVSELACSDRRVGELVALTGKPQNLVSYHLRELRHAGLVSSRRSSFDGRDTYYRLHADHCGEQLQTAAAALQSSLRLVPSLPTTTPPTGRRTRVLFVCTGNSARSQMAAALLDDRAGRSFQARSAGTHPKSLHPLAVQVMAERGIDISGNPTKHLRRYARSHFDWLITLCDKAREVCPDFPGGPSTAHWSMADPAADGADNEESVAAFERTAAELVERIDQLIARALTHQGGSRHARR
jgi:protein-tyrosine-phosphatase/DNA-binding transcriptional ArsR family regulator